MHADTEVAGQTSCSVQRVVAARERSMHSHHSAATGAQEPLVLRQTAPGTLGAVTIGDAVGQVRAHANSGTRIGNDGQTAVDTRGRLVVIHDGGSAAHQRLGGAEHRRPADHLLVERDVEPPPHLLEDLAKLRRLPRRRRHAARQGRVEVVVAADHARGDGAHRCEP